MARAGALLAFGLIALAARGDVIHFKSGGTIEGKIIAETDTEVRLKTGEGQVALPRDRIARIERRETPLEEYTERAARLPEDDAQAHYHLARYCIEHNLHAQAIAMLRRCLAIEPDYSPAQAALRRLIAPRARRLLNQALAHQAEGRYLDAEEPLIDLLETYPESGLAPRAHHLLALGYAARQDYEKAFTRWRRALAADPTLREAAEGAAQAAVQLGRWDDALQFTTQALESAPEAAPLRQRADTLRELIRLEKAAAEQALGPEQLATRGELLFRLGLRERAFRSLEQAYQAGARSAEVLRRLADHYERTGQVRRALELAEELARQEPASDELALRRARLRPLLLIPKALATHDAQEREVLLRRIARSGASFEYIQNAVRHTAERPAQETGKVEGTFVVDEILTRARYLAYVPADYTPARPWPLIIALHRDHDNPPNHFLNWESVAQSDRYLLLFPSARPDATWKFDDRLVVLSALRHAKKLYRVDTNRVTLAGTGSGGLLAWATALRHPDRFAALVTRTAPLDDVGLLYLPNAVNLAVYQLTSERVSPDILSSGREAHTLLQRYQAPCRREEVPGHRHPALPELNPKVLQWLDAQERPPYPRRVVLTTFEHACATAWWIRIDRFTDTVFDPDRKITLPKAPFHLEYTPEQLRDIYLDRMRESLGYVAAVVRPQNTVEVTTREVRALTVWLDDKLVDLDKPVRILVNGRQMFHAKVYRSLDTVFETARLHNDPRLCCSARVELDLARGTARDLGAP